MALQVALSVVTPSISLAMQDEPRELLRLRLPGAFTRQTWITRYAAMEMVRGRAEAVPALASVRHSFERVAMHLDAMPVKDGVEGVWRDLIESALKNTRDAIDLHLWWEPRAFDTHASAWSALRLATRWIGIDEQLKQEILAAFERRGISDMDPDPNIVRLLGSAIGDSAGLPCVGWNQASELWMTMGAEALDMALKVAPSSAPPQSATHGSEHPFLLQVDLSEWTAWFERGLFGREVAERASPRKIAVEKRLQRERASDRVMLPIDVGVSLAGAAPADVPELSLGWLRVSARPRLPFANLTIASLLLRFQGEDEHWIAALRELLERHELFDCQLAGLVCLPPSLLRFRLRPVLWFQGAGPSAAELEGEGFQRVGELWRRQLTPAQHLFLNQGQHYWVVSVDASDAALIAGHLEASSTLQKDADWIGSAGIESYEIYSALWLGLLAQRQTLPMWLRAWVEGLPSPRECGALLSTGHWDLRAAPDAHLVIEGSGVLGDPAFSVLELLLARAALRGLDLWLRDLAEPAYAQATETALATRATALGKWWELHRDADEAAAATAMSEALRWNSAMDPRWNAPPSMQLFPAAELSPALRAALGLDPDVDSCPWVLLETEPWFEGGRSRFVAAWSRGSAHVLRTDFSPPAAISGR